jgi:hypothetical protein
MDADIFIRHGSESREEQNLIRPVHGLGSNPTGSDSPAVIANKVGDPNGTRRVNCNQLHRTEINRIVENSEAPKA